MRGGVYATLVDWAAGETLRTVMRPEDDVTFLRPLLGSRLEAHGRAVKCGSSVGVAVAHICDGRGDVVATGRATFAVRPRFAAAPGTSDLHQAAKAATPPSGADT